MREHEETEDCWCNPRVEIYEVGIGEVSKLIIHRSEETLEEYVKRKMRTALFERTWSEKGEQDISQTHESGCTCGECSGRVKDWMIDAL